MIPIFGPKKDCKTLDFYTYVNSLYIRSVERVERLYNMTVIRSLFIIDSGRLHPC